MFRFRKSKRPKSNRRRGVEAVEAAITLPLLTIVMFSTIQITHRWHVEKLLKIATYEAMKEGASKDGGAEVAKATFEEHAEALGIKGARLLFNENRFDSATTGQYLAMRGVAPAKLNRLPAPINLNMRYWMSGGHVYHRKEGL